MLPPPYLEEVTQTGDPLTYCLRGCVSHQCLWKSEPRPPLHLGASQLPRLLTPLTGEMEPRRQPH